MRRFNIVWQSIKKYPKNLPTSIATVEITNDVGDIGRDAHSALDIFCRKYGNLKSVNILKIQEIDAAGESIGEPILPQTNSIVPVRK